MVPATPSRRQLVAGAAAALVLARAQTMPPAAPVPIQGAADAADRLTVAATIAGRGPYHFIVDTGADHTVLADDIARDLGLIGADDVIVQDIVASVAARTVRLTDLAFGPVALASLTVPVLPRAWLGADGFLGIDAVNGHKVVFDFQSHALTIGKPASAWFPDHLHADEALVPVHGEMGRLTAVDCGVDGVKAQAFIDSGADISIGNSRLFAALQARDGRRYVSDDPIVLTGVTGATATGRLAAVDKVRLGRLDFTNGALVISDLPIFRLWGLAEKPALFIGMNFLKQTSAVTIDYGRKELRFRVAALRLASRV